MDERNPLSEKSQAEFQNIMDRLMIEVLKNDRTKIGIVARREAAERVAIVDAMLEGITPSLADGFL